MQADSDTASAALVNKDAGTTSASPSQLIDPADQSATLVLKNSDGNPNDDANVVKRNYYLVAQWEVGNYKVRFNANGGALGNVQEIADVAFGTNVGTLNIPVTGRGVPTKPGYIFQGWSTTKNPMDNYANAIKVPSGSSATAGAAPAMPSHDLTLYAMWKYDTNKFIVS